VLRLAITLDLELNGTTVTVKLDVENAHGKQPNHQRIELAGAQRSADSIRC
jgi:hypothetical protein